MTDRDIKTTLTELHRELERAPALDDDLRNLLQELDGDIHALLETSDSGENEVSGLRDRVEAMAVDFAAAHPDTERFFREIVNALGRMGI